MRGAGVRRAVGVGAIAAAVAGCGPTTTTTTTSAPTPRTAEGGPRTAEATPRPPTPKSVTKENPGGDADDPERAALERLLAQPWGARPDSWQTLRVDLPDHRLWSNVRIWGHPTRAAHEYGDERYAVSSLWYTPSEGADDAEACLDRFLAYAADVAKGAGVKVGARERVRTKRVTRGQEQTLVVELVEGTGETLLLHDEYVAAVTSYPSWPGTCLVHGFAVVSTRHRALAERVRDRWMREGAPKLDWRPSVRSAPPPHAH